MSSHPNDWEDSTVCLRSSTLALNTRQLGNQEAPHEAYHQGDHGGHAFLHRAIRVDGTVGARLLGSIRHGEAEKASKDKCPGLLNSSCRRDHGCEISVLCRPRETCWREIRCAGHLSLDA